MANKICAVNLIIIYIELYGDMKENYNGISAALVSKQIESWEKKPQISPG